MVWDCFLCPEEVLAPGRGIHQAARGRAVPLLGASSARRAHEQGQENPSIGLIALLFCTGICVCAGAACIGLSHFPGHAKAVDARRRCVASEV